MQASIIINVSDVAQSHSNGLSGIYVVPAKGEDEFGMLIVYSAREVQGVADQRVVEHWPKSRKVAQDILGIGSDSAAHAMGASGTKHKWGLYLCAAEPETPKELLEAIEAEGEFLNANPPDVKQKYDQQHKINVALNIEPDSVKAQKQKLSDRVQELRAAFEQECRSLVTKKEIAAAKKAMLNEDQRLIGEADQMWARGEESRRNINELHQAACRRLGQERPWCYTPQQLSDCPGCGAKIKENVLSCAHCGGWLDEGIEQLREMKPKERALKMYPERYAEPVTAGDPKPRARA